MRSHSRRLCLIAMQPVRKEALMEKSPMDLAEAKYSFSKLQQKEKKTWCDDLPLC